MDVRDKYDRLSVPQRSTRMLELLTQSDPIHSMSYVEKNVKYLFESIFREPIASLEKKLLNDGGTIVDLGTGTGEYAAVLAKRYPRATVLGLDVQDILLEEARKRHEKINNAIYVNQNAYEIAYKNIDLITAFSSLCEFDELGEIVKKIHSNLRKEGVFFVYDRKSPNDILGSKGLQEFHDAKKESYEKGTLDAVAKAIDEMLTKAGDSAVEVAHQLEDAAIICGSYTLKELWDACEEVNFSGPIMSYVPQPAAMIVK